MNQPAGDEIGYNAGSPVPQVSKLVRGVCFSSKIGYSVISWLGGKYDDLLGKSANIRGKR